MPSLTPRTNMEFEQTLGDSEGQGSLACCSPRGRKESGTTEPLNNKKSNQRRGYGLGAGPHSPPVAPVLINLSEPPPPRPQ